MSINKFLDSLFSWFKNQIRFEAIKMFRFDREMARRWTHIIIHHSFTKDGNTYDWKAISRYHVREKGWSAIGYHFGIEKEDNIYVYCIGRGLDKSGGHTKEKRMNFKAIGICLIGNFDRVNPNKTQYWLLASLCRNLMKTFKIPIENIERHNKYATKTCPGAKFQMDILKKYIKGEKLP